MFLWLSWILWIIVTFFMTKSRTRTLLAIWILLTIIGSNMFIVVENYYISYAYLSMIIGALIMHGKCLRWIYHIFVSLTVMIGYTAILLWEYTSPIWMVLPRFVIIPSLCCLMILPLVRGIYNQLMTGLLGICSGELLYSLMLSGYHLHKPIGDSVFLDHILLIMSSLFVIHIIHQIRAKLFALSQTVPPPIKWPDEKIM